jgi:hypothetical protein
MQVRSKDTLAIKAGKLKLSGCPPGNSKLLSFDLFLYYNHNYKSAINKSKEGSRWIC